MINILLLLYFFCAPYNNEVPVKYLCQQPLDAQPMVEADAHLQGLWKLNEDTNAHNYFVVERDGNYRLNVTYMTVVVTTVGWNMPKVTSRK
ncbi:hypothetical protein GCM10023093_31130 [Nemorincola caseinilytica]|uniref:Secreted protein n=1 Tax=Nemorincola caseinilytica TaxID=2054315 RepID=A0ABP8NSA7_9BACT